MLDRDPKGHLLNDTGTANSFSVHGRIMGSKAKASDQSPVGLLTDFCVVVAGGGASFCLLQLGGRVNAVAFHCIKHHLFEASCAVAAVNDKVAASAI